MIFHTLKIKEIRKETTDCVSILFDIPEHLTPNFVFKQGQYLTLKANVGGEEIRRSYSICSAPFENELRIAIKKVEGGKFSTYANKKLKKGDTLEVAPPDGRFNTLLNFNNKKHYVLIAAGSGITPILSILKSVLKEEPQSEVTLIYGNKNAASVIFREEIEGLKNKNMQRLRVFHVLSRERVDAELLHGRINASKMKAFIEKMPEILLRNEIPTKSGRGSEYFLCGPEDMINDIRQVLSEHHIDTKNIHFELFGTNKKNHTHAVISTEKVVSTATIKLDGISFDVPIHEGEMVLDAALRMGADLPFACKGGVCCTCRAQITEGVVEMEVNYALDHDELERGYILTCQSIPKTARLVIDFDAK
jgi:ring-1,2-phenylacetyl-CoA epoxidase subunit PaaE